MEEFKIHIRNVVCQRCIMTVKQILDKLEIPFAEVRLGEAILKRKPEPTEIEAMEKEFSKVGFELIQEKETRLINMVKSAIIEEVYSEEASNGKLSEILTSKFHHDYSHITHTFSRNEGQSIQQFFNSVRIERVKDLILNTHYNMAEIADLLGYSTPAYLSTSFKKATGLTPSEYKSQRPMDRKRLDQV